MWNSVFLRIKVLKAITQNHRTMEKDHQGQVEKILKELGHKIDGLIEETKSASGELRDELEEKVKEFKGKKGKLEEEYEEFKTQNESRWDEVKSHLSGAAIEIENAAKAAFGRKK
ncbi:MAG: putative nuclease with TOPRIM domain [Bacteroidia bacterium]